ERLREEVARSLRHGQPVSLLIGDIDDFSALNHDLGDQAGDEVLRRIALIMTEEPNTRLRDSDVAGRFGGDEIAVLLPETGKPGAIVKAQRLCDAIAGAEMPGDRQVTMSFGITTVPDDGNSVQEILRCAE